MDELLVDLTTATITDEEEPAEGFLADQPELAYGPVKSNGRHPTRARLFPASRDESREWDFSYAAGGWGSPYNEVGEGLGRLRDARVLIVDDCTLYREFLASVIVSHGALTPGVAWDVPSLITAFETTLPRVVVLNMGARDSTILLRRALSLGPQVRVIVLGVSEDDESEIVACAEAGVAGYHLRTETLQDLLALIQKVAAGESLCSPGVSAILLRRLSALASQRPSAAKELVLTTREIQILGMLELGLANREIAEQLCIAVHTVKNHVHSLLTKLGVSTRAQAATLARSILAAEDKPEI